MPSVLQAIEPYVSSEDIDKGARWNTDISKELEDSSFGILCITPENLAAPWLNFEAGALSKSLDRARVAPFLFKVERTAITGPLLQFQSTLIEADDVRKLVKSLNQALDEQSLDEGRLDEIFDVWWPRLEDSLGAIPEESEARPKSRSQVDLLSEVLELVRSQQQLLSRPTGLLPPEYLQDVLGALRPESVHPKAIRDLKSGWRRVRKDVEGLDQDSPLVQDIERLGLPIDYLLRELDEPSRRTAWWRQSGDPD